MALPAIAAKTKDNVSKDSGTSIIREIENRQTEELIIAFCGPLGSGTSIVSKEVAKLFASYKYTVELRKVSGLITDRIGFVKNALRSDIYIAEAGIDPSQPIESMNKGQRIAFLQSAGNYLRRMASADILSQLAIKEIALKRTDDAQNMDQESPIPRKSRRKVTLIDSLKHPDEVKLLRIVYGNMFYLFGVLCPEEIRRKRLTDQKKIDQALAVKLMNRDKAEEEKYGQQLLKTLFQADLFIRNTKSNIDSISPNLNRFIKIILGEAPITPTKEESAMYFAQSASVRSGCLSRQVGAAIINDDGELISTGCNDVPKAGGGLYSAQDGDEDNRCMNWYEKKCINDDYKKKLFSDISTIVESHVHGQEQANQIINEIKSHDRIKNLIEYCRAIHAEMDAITTAARNGSSPLKGAMMFCTTFPCHHCARHIIASGIRVVFYIEPYEKSLAIELHRDSIVFDPEGFDAEEKERGKNKIIKKVYFIPFEGIAPRRYLDLFQARERKIDGKRAIVDLNTSKPIIVQLIDTFIEYESKVVENLHRVGFED